jgi:hypothetical protein
MEGLLTLLDDFGVGVATVVLFAGAVLVGTAIFSDLLLEAAAGRVVRLAAGLRFRTLDAIGAATSTFALSRNACVGWRYPGMDRAADAIVEDIGPCPAEVDEAGRGFELEIAV